jgi:hypothetical protein
VANVVLGHHDSGVPKLITCLHDVAAQLRLVGAGLSPQIT